MNYSFNYKKKTRKNVKNNNTLDYLHTKKIDSINNKKNKLNDYIKKKNELQKNIINYYLKKIYLKKI